jgi:hypothetical protein
MIELILTAEAENLIFHDICSLVAPRRPKARITVKKYMF